MSIPEVHISEVGVSTLDIEEEEFQVEQESSEHPPDSPSSPLYSRKRKKTLAEHMADGDELLIQALGQLAKTKLGAKDEASVYADGWATSFRKLSLTQQIYAKRAIEEILVLGQVNALTFQSVSTHGSGNIASDSSSTQ